MRLCAELCFGTWVFGIFGRGTFWDALVCQCGGLHRHDEEGGAESDAGSGAGGGVPAGNGRERIRKENIVDEKTRFVVSV